VSAPVVVCTYRHGDDLVAALDSLLEELPAEAAVVVVRSGVDAGTPMPPRLDAWFGGAADRVTVVCEPTPGAARARAAGLEAVTADVVLFVDDDVTVRRGWYEALRAGMTDADVAAAGGAIVVAWPNGGRPPWLDDRLATYFGERRPGSEHLPFAANMALRRAPVAHAGGMPFALGPAASGTGMHDDTALCERLLSLGYRVVDTPGAVVEHHVRPEHVTVPSVLRRAFAEGRFDCRRDHYVRAPEPVRRLVKLAGLVLTWPIALLRARWRVYVTARVLANVGYLVEWAPLAPRGRTRDTDAAR
jgi:GT2 family glycosyltransferase